MNRVEITLQDIFVSLKRYFILIVLTTLIFTLGAWIYTQCFITPLYTTQVSMCVFASQRTNDGVTTGELNADASIARTYCLLLTSQSVLQAVSDELNGEVSARAIGRLLSTSANAQVIYVTVTAAAPALAVRVANAVSDVAPEALSSITRAGELIPLDRAVMPTAPSSPNVSSNVMIGFLIGLLLSCAVVILITLLDTTIWREEDLEHAFRIPVLGSVPSMLPKSQLNGKKRNRKRSF